MPIAVHCIPRQIPTASRLFELTLLVPEISHCDCPDPDPDPDLHSGLSRLIFSSPPTQIRVQTANMIEEVSIMIGHRQPESLIANLSNRQRSEPRTAL